MNRRMMVVAVLLLAVSAASSVVVNEASLSLMHALMGASTSPFRGPYEGRPVINPSEVRRTLRLGAIGARLAPRSWSSIAGRTLIGAGQYREGADLLSSIPNVRANDALAAGNGYAAAGRRNDALRLWTRSTPLRAERLEIAKRLHAECVKATYVVANRCRDAIDILNTVQPPDRETLFLLASVHDSLDDHGVGAALMDELLVRGSDPQAEDSKLLYLDRDGRTDEALALAGKVLASRASWAAFYVRGSIRLQRCDTAGAVGDLERALTAAAQKDYRSTWIRLRLGTALWERGDESGALQQWREYVRNQPAAPLAKDYIRLATEGRLPRRCSADGVRRVG